MITMSANWLENMTAPSRYIKGKVELENGLTFLPTDNLVSIKIEKIPTNGSFFGYSISQKTTIVVLDRANDLLIEKGEKLNFYLGTEDEQVKSCDFFVEEVVRDEVKKSITITAYDLIYTASQKLQKELTINFPITLREYADAVATFLGSSIVWDLGETAFVDITYDNLTPPNFGGNETLREILTAIAGATGTICFMDADNKIKFKRLVNNPTATIDKSLYFELKLGQPITLTQLSHVTELGDNYIAGEAGGHNQIIRSNPFLENRTDIAEIITSLLECVNGTTIYPYTIKWRGNPAFEIGDCVNLDDKVIYYLGETINYTGGMSATSEWKEAEQDKVDGTPTNLGQAITETFAKVDKVNGTIELLASNVEDANTAISNLQIDAESIKSSVSSVQQTVDANKEEVNGQLDTLTKKVEATMTDEQVQIKIDSALENGVDKVITSTGFTFNEEGLTVSKSGSEMTTRIDEDGMTVYRDNLEVLVADNTGVIARNLHAETYLIIGTNSRFEDYTDLNYEARTGCFWIGGAK